MRLFISIALLAVLAVTLVAVGNGSAKADLVTTVDFEGLAEGLIVSSVSSGSGISGDPVAGSISVFGVNAKFPGVNSAMVFDATCTPVCSGEDDDLNQPASGNVLIISEDLDSSDPDDDSKIAGQTIQFDFSGFGPGVVTVNSLNAIDIDLGQLARVDLYNSGFLIGSVPIPPTGDGNISTIAVDVAGVDYMDVVLDGSGAIDNVQLTIEEIDPQIDIEKYTRVDAGSTGEGDQCDILGKPIVLTMQYTGDGDDATSHSQDDGKVNVSGDPDDASPVRIVVSSKEDPNDSKAKIYTDTTVALGGFFDIDATAVPDAKDNAKLGSKTFVFVYNSDDELLQSVEFHTSCSQPLGLGDQFGSVLLTGWDGTDGEGTLPVAVPSTDLGEDADTPTGPEAQLGDKIVWNYVVTNPGDTELADVVVTDDAGTPGDTSDDFNPDAVVDGGFNVGDTDADGRLDPSETWLYMAMGTAQLGQYGNLSDVTGTPVDDNGDTIGDDVTDEDPSHYFVDVPDVPQGDQCDILGKPVVLTLQYTGDGDDATSHSQDDGKVNVSGDSDDASPVRIVVSSKEDQDDKKAKIYTDTTVALGGFFDIDAAAVPDAKDNAKLGSKTFVFVYNSDDELLQSVEFHTSCSQPLAIGDQFGSVLITGWVGMN